MQEGEFPTGKEISALEMHILPQKAQPSASSRISNYNNPNYNISQSHQCKKFLSLSYIVEVTDLTIQKVSKKKGKTTGSI